MSIFSKLVYDYNLLALRYMQKNKRIRALYTKVVTESCLHPKRVVVMANEMVHNGGLGDRLHGFISIYIFCQEEGLDFKINFCDPFRLHDYLEPNEYEWDIDPQDIIYDLNVAEPVHMACTFKKYGGTPEQEASFMNRYLKWRINKFPKKEFHVYTNEHLANTPEVYSKCFHQLFKPSEALNNAIKWNKSRIGSDYIAIVLRFQNLLGDFLERDFPTLSETEQCLLMDKVLIKIKDIFTSKHLGSKILVTSDSRKFLDFAEQLSYVYTIPGKVVHMSYTPIRDFDIHLKSFVDLMMLADAKKIYLLVVGKMFHSGFAESASFINNRPYEVIKMD